MIKQVVWWVIIVKALAITTDIKVMLVVNDGVITVRLTGPAFPYFEESALNLKTRQKQPSIQDFSSVSLLICSKGNTEDLAQSTECFKEISIMKFGYKYYTYFESKGIAKDQFMSEPGFSASIEADSRMLRYLAYVTQEKDALTVFIFPDPLLRTKDETSIILMTQLVGDGGPKIVSKPFVFHAKNKEIGAFVMASTQQDFYTSDTRRLSYVVDYSERLVLPLNVKIMTALENFALPSYDVRYFDNSLGQFFPTNQNYLRFDEASEHLSSMTLAEIRFTSVLNSKNTPIDPDLYGLRYSDELGVANVILEINALSASYHKYLNYKVVPSESGSSCAVDITHNASFHGPQPIYDHLIFSSKNVILNFDIDVTVSSSLIRVATSSECIERLANARAPYNFKLSRSKDKQNVCEFKYFFRPTDTQDFDLFYSSDKEGVDASEITVTVSGAANPNSRSGVWPQKFKVTPLTSLNFYSSKPLIII